MDANYNNLAGRSLGRLAGLSDGVFSVAMTLLVLDLTVPAAHEIANADQLRIALVALAPKLISYMMSFLTLGIFWNGQQVQLENLTEGDRHLSWINLAFLFAVTLVPFSTGLLAAFIDERLALLIYWANILLLGLLLLASWSYAMRAGLVDPKIDAPRCRAILRRIIVAQCLYALGAALCVIDTYVSIGWIVLLQLNYAVAPPVKWLRNL